MSKLVRFVHSRRQGHRPPASGELSGGGPDAIRTRPECTQQPSIKAAAQGRSLAGDRILQRGAGGEFGKEQEIEIGPLSGLSNVKHWLARHEIPADEPSQGGAGAGQASNRTLTESEVAQIVREVRS